MIEIKISGATVAEVQETAAKLLGIGATPMPVGERQSGAPLVTNTPRAGESAEQTAARTRRGKKSEPEKQAIQTGGERVGPEDDPNDEKAMAEAAQDDADEKADKESANELTHDSVRAVLGEYVKRYGMPAAQEDGPKVISMMFGKGKSKVSDIPDDQASLKKAVAGVEEMLAKNPFKREAVRAK